MRWLALGLLMIANCTVAETFTSNLSLTIWIDSPPPCSLTVEDLDFGTVVISKLNNSSYKKLPLHFSLSCSEEDQSLTIRMKIIATALDDSTAGTSSSGLGIRFFSGDSMSPLPLNSFITDQGSPNEVVARGISVLPVVIAGATPQAGEFRAQISLQMEYQ